MKKNNLPLRFISEEIIHYLVCRAFSVAKALMKENKYARDKKDNLIYLNEDGKLQEVSYIIGQDS